MIFEGKFKSIDNNYIYYLKIGNAGITREIQDGDIDAYHDGKILCFSGDSPIIIESDMSDTFENVIIRSMTVCLISNFDIREYVVAENYMDIPIIVKQAEVGYNDQDPLDYWTMVFDGYVNPLSFNQPFAKKWNEFELECTDRLGVLEYKQFPALLNGNYEYNTPRYFMNLALSVCGFSGINYNIEYDHTTDTKINPAIFVGESEDDWMTCLEVIQEIGKLYGCFFWQDGSVCYVQNILLYNVDNVYLVQKEDYMSDDANISVDEAYNLIKCEVDISSIDSDFIDPFDKDSIIPTTKWPERILTEFLSNGEDTENLVRFAVMLINTNTIKDWSSWTGASWKECEIYDHYAQIMKNKLFDFTLYDIHGNITRPSYLDDASDGGGGGNSDHDAITTLNWLKEHPGRGAFIGYACTDNVIDQKNTSSVNIKDMKKALVIQVGGHASDETTETLRIESQIQNNIPICSYKLESSSNLTPNDVSTINYLLINGTVMLNPVQAKTGIDWTDNIYNRSRNTVAECLNTWSLYPTIYSFVISSANSLYERTIMIDNDEDKLAYYQTCSWTNTGDTENYPFNQNPVTNRKDLFYPYLNTKNQMFKWQGSYYEKDEPSEVDDLNYVPILACELKIGNKYLCEDVDKMKQYNWQNLNPEKLQEIYKWMTSSEASAAGLSTHFTLGVDPSIGDFMIGADLKIKETTNVSTGISENGFAIPIPYSAALNGEVSFKILGPVNASWDDVGYDKSGWLFWKNWWTTHNHKTLLSYVENIIITDISFKLVSDNQRKEQLNDDNDLIYYSVTSERYIDEKDFSCKFCTSLTTNEVNALGIDYNLNNSSILGLDNLPWYGMTYKNESGVKLEEARVSEQYNIWGKPRNIFEATLRLAYPEKCNYMQNFTFSYIDGIYKIISREIDLKLNTMNCKMKDFS